MDIQNTLLDDLCAEIGYTATTVICAWYGGNSLYVPTSTDTDNHLRRLIGQPAFNRLVATFGGAQIRCVPKNIIAERLSRHRKVFDLLRNGASTAQVSTETGLSGMQVINVRRDLEEAGLLPVILREPPQ